MTTLTAFDRRFTAQVVALWRTLHPDWDWLNDAAAVTKALTMEPPECLGYVAERDGGMIGTIFGSCAIVPDAPRNRYLTIDAQPAHLSADWLGPALQAFMAIDGDLPGTWQMVGLSSSTPTPSSTLLVTILEAAGFSLRERLLVMEWEGDTVAVVDPGAAVLERYAGGSAAVDAEIVDLHTRAYRTARLVPPASVERLWANFPGMTDHEYVLARDAGRLVGYAEFFVIQGKPYINSMVAARSHWGKSIGAAAGTKAMEILIGLGHRKLHATVATTNAAARSLHRQHGWRDAGEMSCTYVREIPPLK